KEVLGAIDDSDASLTLNVRRGDNPGRALGDAQHGVLDALVERQRQRLEVADDLMNILDDARDGLVLVEHSIDAESPHRRAAQRREEKTPHGVPEGVSEAALERLKSEFCDVGIVFALRRFD